MVYWTLACGIVVVMEMVLAKFLFFCCLNRPIGLQQLCDARLEELAHYARPSIRVCCPTNVSPFLWIFAEQALAAAQSVAPAEGGYAINGRYIGYFFPAMVED